MSATTAEDVIAGIEEKYRTCLDTGLKVYEKTETLIKINAVTAVVFLAIGGLLGVLAVTVSQQLLPWGLAFAAGAMIYVIVHEIIPEIHDRQFANEATAGLTAGLVIMMFLEWTDWGSLSPNPCQRSALLSATETGAVFSAISLAMFMAFVKTWSCATTLLNRPELTSSTARNTRPV